MTVKYLLWADELGKLRISRSDGRLDKYTGLFSDVERFLIDDAVDFIICVARGGIVG